MRICEYDEVGVAGETGLTYCLVYTRNMINRCGEIPATKVKMKYYKGEHVMICFRGILWKESHFFYFLLISINMKPSEFLKPISSIRGLVNKQTLCFQIPRERCMLFH